MANRLTSLADSANLNFTYNFDAENRLKAQASGSGFSKIYAYDKSSRISSVIEDRVRTDYARDDQNHFRMGTRAGPHEQNANG